MMHLTFGLSTQVNDSEPHDLLVFVLIKYLTLAYKLFFLG